MALHLYNSLARRKESFHPRRGKTVAMYNCGPTVYDYVHIGNLRSFLFADVLRRYLEYRGYRVRQIMNITDVGHMVGDTDTGEDKMSVAMRREGKGPVEVARFYEEKFFEDIDALGVRRAWKYPRATEHVPQMIALVKKLLKRGHAYIVCHPEERSDEGSRTHVRASARDSSPMAQNDNCDVYYDLSTFPNYGKLSGNTVRDLIPGARAEVVHEKRNPYDFALWIYKPNHVLQWETPWGRGYPGWHLECSAMAMKYLGPTLDIHTGGEDNQFPHHECEIAQSEGASDKPFVRYWLHAKHLLVDGKKMSKSLGNFYTLRELLQKGYSARAVRYALISTHYRETLNFTLESIKAAENALARIDEVMAKLQSRPSTTAFGLRSGDKNILPERSAVESKVITSIISKSRKDFIAAMDDDLNVSRALAVLFELVRKVNKTWNVERGTWNVSDGRQVMAFLKEVDQVLGLGLSFGALKKTTTIPAEVATLTREREAARRAKDWKRADEIRDELKYRGYQVEDAPEGPRLKKL